MNKYQRLIITVAIIDLIVILLFPPFVERSLARNALTSFDGFYFLLSEIGRRPIDSPLLSLELIWIVANALSAWQLLSTESPAESQNQQEPFGSFGSFGSFGIAMFALVNLTIIFLFPPFEQYNSLLRSTAPGFDSFYFVFGDRSARPFFTPLLQLEVFFILINALALHLLFSAIERSESAVLAQRAAETKNALPTQQSTRGTTRQRVQFERQNTAHLPALGRKDERRHHDDPHYRGRERRTGYERRHIE